jgi:spoIIIJ-associated protein
MAEQVAATHKPAALEPMPANERRIVHLALRDDTQVRTESVGVGENRKVTIIPQSYKR